MNLLIPYIHKFKHQDPLFEEFTYGDVRYRGRRLKETLQKGDYVFFHSSSSGHKLITAYYVTDRVVSLEEVVKNQNLLTKFKNPHIIEVLEGERELYPDETLLFGDPIESRILEKALPFDRNLAKKLSLKIPFPRNRTEAQAIASATRSWRELSIRDVEILMHEIQINEEKGIRVETVLSTDEVAQIIEVDLENVIEENPTLLGSKLKVIHRQMHSPVGRIDLLLSDDKDNLIVIELKIGSIGRQAVSQIRRYIRWLRKETDKNVSGVIICKDVMPAFQEEISRLKGVKIYCYGWQLKIYPWEKGS